MTNPFDLSNPAAYLDWRAHKLAHAITETNELMVEIKDPHALTAAERDAVLSCCQRSNMVVYASTTPIDERGMQHLSIQLGLQRLDANWLAGEQGITRITVCRDENTRQTYIPYTDRAIKWHTDGYYNPSERQIRAMVLHCVHEAGSGGENRIMDHEIAYLLLRDANPDFIRALYAPDVMTIPERVDETDGIRPAQTGSVFSVDATGRLHMRYTARTRSIAWKQDDTTLAAVKFLEQLLATPSPHIHQLKLQAGMGLLCNNVLHDRTAFTDDPNHPRLLYRARYLDRIADLP
ncbi:MAG: TauD/TfdA family dioxygenase [Gallionella sp.]|nr:TauD/TfdA family dioxygenase [Gallionella sp.]MDD4958269.1 TauD/TfdA family dioxygenase [Gallionella sp.]